MMIVVISFLAHPVVVTDKNIRVINANDVVEAGSFYDVALFDEASSWDFNDFYDISENKKIFRLLVVDGEDSQIEHDDILKREDLKNLSQKLDAVAKELTLRKELYLRDLELQQFYVNFGVHIENFEIIKAVLSNSTKKIEENFEDKIKRLKAVSASLKELELQDEKLNANIKEIDNIVKGIFNYVSILQCEDRIFQMINGIKNIMHNDMIKIKTKNIEMNELIKNKLMKELVPFYTIQEQRDFALGINIAESIADNEAGKIIIF